MGSYDYAGCLSLPRVMYISGNRLHQVWQPHPPFSGRPSHCLLPCANPGRSLHIWRPFDAQCMLCDRMNEYVEQ